jgi:hypothetical protein
MPYFRIERPEAISRALSPVDYLCHLGIPLGPVVGFSTRIGAVTSASRAVEAPVSFAVLALWLVQP